MADDKKSQVHNVTSFNQSGGVTAHTYINQAPAPGIRLASRGVPERDGEGFKRVVRVELANPPNMLAILARGGGVSHLLLVNGFTGAGMCTGGEAQDGWKMATAQAPVGQMNAVIYSQTNGPVELMFSFDGERAFPLS